MSSVEEVKRLLTEALDPTELEVIDVSGNCGSAFDVHVISQKFEGKNRLAVHRLIHDALASVMGDIHALSIKTAKAPSKA
jgi:stress-induced morphogen